MRDKVLQLLGDVIGTEPDDISEEDSLREDLHMNAVDLAELSEKLSTAGFEVDLSDIETVEDLLSSLNLEEEI